MFRTASFAALVGCALTLSVNGAQAQAKITLRFADSLPATHLFTTALAKPWMEDVTKATDGEVTFEHYPSEQLGKAKDMLCLARSGVEDIAFVVPIYITDKLPERMSSVMPSRSRRSRRISSHGSVRCHSRAGSSSPSSFADTSCLDPSWIRWRFWF